MPSSSTAASQAGPFIIKILEGPLASAQLMTDGDVPPGQIWLRGRALPYRPIAFKGKQRVKTTWLPGNPVATQQVNGPTEEPTTINGQWKDKYLGNGVAMGLAELFRQVRRAGPLLEVSWGAGIVAGVPIGKAIVMRGIMSDTEFTIERPQDVQWRVTFDWRGDDQAVAPATLAIGVENPRQGFANVQQSLQDMVDSLVGFQDSPFNSLVRLPGTILADVESVAKQTEDVMALISNASGLGTSLVQLPTVVAQRAIQVGLKGAVLAQQLRDLLLSLNPLTQQPVDNALDLLLWQGQRYDTMRSADVAQAQALVAVNALQGQILPEVQAEVRPPPGTDLRDIALQFYGDPDLWWIIAQYNGLEGSAVPPPPTGPSDNPAPAILVPRRIEGDLGQLNC